MHRGDDGVSRSPFQPCNPVDPRFFVGRTDLLTGIRRVADGSNRDGNARVAYLCGPKRIGKTSLAYYVRMGLERAVGRYGFHVFLGAESGPATQQDFMEKLLRKIIEAKSDEPALMARVEQIFRHVILEVTVAGISFKQRELSDSAPRDASQLLVFFDNFSRKFYGDSQTGFVLILDEIDGVACQPFFAHFLKELVDAGTAGSRRVPLLVILCGTAERLNMIRRNNQRACEQMEVFTLEPLNPSDVKHFFERAFDASGRAIDVYGMDVLVHFCAGLPMLMHLLGETALAVCPTDRAIGKDEAYKAANEAAERWGRTHDSERWGTCFEDPRYKHALRYLAGTEVESSFSRAAILMAAGDDGAPYADSLVQRLLDDGFIEHGARRGEYHFVNPLASLALHRLGINAKRMLGHTIL